MSITAGYHRLISHRSYDANSFLKLCYLIFGAGAFQGSALKWCSDHRRHHKYVDLETDPYAITKGFWYAHIGWLFLKEAPDHESHFASDLKSDRWIALQHKYYVPIAIIVGFLLPTLIGLVFFGRPGGGLLYGGFMRILFSHHTTFFINSLCHVWGNRPYTLKTSARDNIVMAVLTCGEGYHNYHHRFEADFRNGIRWYHWDPTKWFIQSAAYFKMARNLRRVPDTEILKAKLAVQENALKQKGRHDERIQSLRARIEDTHKQVARLKLAYREIKSELAAQGAHKYEQGMAKWEQGCAKLEQSREQGLAKWEHGREQGRAKLAQIKFEIATAKIELRAAMKQWHLVMKTDIAFA